MFIRNAIVVGTVFALLPNLRAADKEAPAAIGWRGNLTGIFPDSKVPVEWSIVSTGPAEGMKCAATVPDDARDPDVAPVDGGRPPVYRRLRCP